MDIGMKTGSKGIHRMYDTGVFERYELSNGINIWLQKPPIMVSGNGVLAAVLAGVGAQADPPDEPGIAHFFEHIPFRGTETKPSNLEIMKPLVNVGGKIGARTDLLLTDFQVQAPSD